MYYMDTGTMRRQKLNLFLIVLNVNVSRIFFRMQYLYLCTCIQNICGNAANDSVLYLMPRPAGGCNPDIKT